MATGVSSKPIQLKIDGLNEASIQENTAHFSFVSSEKASAFTKKISQHATLSNSGIKVSSPSKTTRTLKLRTSSPTSELTECFCAKSIFQAVEWVSIATLTSGSKEYTLIKAKSDEKKTTT